ncbi:hypothetical protein PFISCL1PPCAC_17202 [Pristionchus fissidentatus]|uniref:Mutator-like transposase domain-containing protein n=1 Tax=Pristionchus fissidentatus TaxID=1538716 RepID=A0AAV5W6B5_9BILA|nr:hypothetical protein PFISCL1PPCAC_17202 [Pristionchus fissidentatus]
MRTAQRERTSTSVDQSLQYKAPSSSKNHSSSPLRIKVFTFYYATRFSQETTDSQPLYSVPNLPLYVLVDSSLLLDLFRRCPECGTLARHSLESMSRFVNGSAIKLSWECVQCDKTNHWESQKRMGLYYEGNVKLVAAAHTTAVPTPRLLEFGDQLGLALPCERAMRNVLDVLVLPAVDMVYKEHIGRVEQTVRDVNGTAGLDLSVDGRYDSPGYCAMHCTVTFVCLRTNLIILVKNLNKKMTEIDGVSGRMEKEGVKMGLRKLMTDVYKIRSVVSDNDAKIGKMLREDPQFSNIRHLLDFWHLVKAVNHALREAGKKKMCGNIRFWRRKILSHAYYCHSKYGKNRKKGLEYWKSVLAHVCGRHKNFQKLPFLDGISKCRHKELGPASTNIIDRRSKEFQFLKTIVLKPTFLSGFLRASPKKNTSPNECFNSIVNLYAPKRISLSPAMYGEKIKLAVLHYNTLSTLDLLDLRKEKSSYLVSVKGRESKSVKRKMETAIHEWRDQCVPFRCGRGLVERWRRRN